MTTRTKAKRADPKQALLDAAEKLLITEGYAGVTTRRVASVAGLNQALVHYHFGSLPELFLAVHDRMSEVFQSRVLSIFADDEPLAVKWQKMQEMFFQADMQRGYPKIHLELMTLAANRPELRERVVSRLAFLRTVFVEALRSQLQKSGSWSGDQQVEALAALAELVVNGALIEKILGYERGHTQAFAMLDEQLAVLTKSRSKQAPT
jgi:AcrR family transcriptional regulator